MEPGNPGQVRTATILADTTRPNSFSTPSFYRVEFVSGDIKSYGESVFYDRSGGRGLHFDCDGRTRHLHAAEQILGPTTLNGLSVSEIPVSFVRDPPTLLKMNTAPDSSGIGDTLRCPADTHGLGNSTGAAFGHKSAP